MILPMPDGRWLLPLTTAIGAADSSAFPGVRLYDPVSGAMETFGPLSPGHAEAHPALTNPIKMVVRAAGGQVGSAVDSNQCHGLNNNRALSLSVHGRSVVTLTCNALGLFRTHQWMPLNDAAARARHRE